MSGRTFSDGIRRFRARPFLRLAAVLLLSLCIVGCVTRPPAGIDEPVSGETLRRSLPLAPAVTLEKRGFTVGYSEPHRQALWVCHILTAEQLAAPKVRRSDRFRADPAVPGIPVAPEEYRGSGFDRGHLAPAADMSYSAEAMEDSFLMSNISPQRPGCNRGIWADLEAQVRRWARREGRLMVISGPIFGGDGKIGRGIPVPRSFYKIVFDLTPPLKMIAFIVPNGSSKKPISAFAVTVDEVEALTGYDFFGGLEDELEKFLESSADYALWAAPPHPAE